MRRVLVYSVTLVIHALAILGVAIGVKISNGLMASICVAIYVFSFAVGNGSLLVVYLSEILPNIGFGVGFAFQWATSALIGIGIP